MLSVLIITYGRVEELLETLNCVNSYKGNAIEVLLLDNNATDDLKNSVENIFSKNSSIKFKYFNDGINYGVAKGRNYLIDEAQGDILVTIDDDVEIDDFNIFIEKIENYFSNDDISVLAFNIKNFYTRVALRHEIPHGRKDLDLNCNFDTYYFIGAGHAIRKSVYEIAGKYPLDLGLYGGEERDLSFRVLETGGRILYASDIVLYHKVSPNGRMPRKEENYYRYRNQLIVLNRYMPLFYRFTSNVIWSFYYLLKSGKVLDIFKTIIEVSNIEKRTISKETLDKMSMVKARKLY